MNLVIQARELEKAAFKVRTEAQAAIEKVNRALDLGGLTRQQEALLADAIKHIEKIVKVSQ